LLIPNSCIYNTNRLIDARAVDVGIHSAGEQNAVKEKQLDKTLSKIRVYLRKSAAEKATFFYKKAVGSIFLPKTCELCSFV
jgi:hypothetical protein